MNTHTTLQRRGRARPISIAPMMDRTDRHYRYMMRMFTQHTLLYSEMITTGAIIYGDQARHLDFSPLEHPLVLQLGGDNPKDLAQCAKIAVDWGYDEINLNVGCPSSRVQSGNFGACLMLDPDRVARAVEAMRQAVDIAITVKHRIGVDEYDRYEDMHRFVSVVSQAGSDGFSVHARKAWLSGLSPKENRTIPPLRYQEIYRLKKEFPHLFIEINGGIKTWDEINTHLEHVDAVMIGRAAYSNPRLFHEADARLFPDFSQHPQSWDEIIGNLADYLDHCLQNGTKAHHITRHFVHLFAGLPGNKYWRRTLSEKAVQGLMCGQVLKDSWQEVQERQAYAQQRSQKKSSNDHSK